MTETAVDADHILRELVRPARTKTLEAFATFGEAERRAVAAELERRRVKREAKLRAGRQSK